MKINNNYIKSASKELEVRNWGQTFKLTIEPFAKEEDVWNMMFSSSKGDNDDHQHHNLLRRRMEYSSKKNKEHQTQNMDEYFDLNLCR
ncbi:3368_t:CDS:2 [Ambispora gerdemannii]|uniref:3368_t:CDS:1 n=1 Tax=Ambispora gerdemannii TaxID=144530 RepID=A0A9N9GF06_9GLOM|nr:3368_t:CDS:2 [Ambispora gerdemannii]